MYPVKFQTQTDFRGRALGDSLMDEVEDVNLHIIHGLASISVEMSRHLGLLRIMCYLVNALGTSVSDCSCLADVLFLASGAHYAIHQVAAVAAGDISCP